MHVYILLMNAKGDIEWYCCQIFSLSIKTVKRKREQQRGELLLGIGILWAGKYMDVASILVLIVLGF